METAKVDIRKLQLLNDRISQTIDALNQVRMSVHGLAHSTPFQQIGIPGYPQPYGQQPYGQQAFGQQPFGYPQVPQLQPGLGMTSPWGLGHSNPVIDPVTAMRYAQAAQLQAAQLQGITPWSGGLSHSAPEGLDPFLTARYVQTFPYALTPVPLT